MIENRRIPWASIGVLAVILMAVVALCCLCSPGSPPPPCDVPPAPVVVPAADASVPDDAGSPCDAAPAPPPIALDAGFDAGPSCGTHPWCPHPKPCCRDEWDCCSS